MGLQYCGIMGYLIGNVDVVILNPPELKYAKNPVRNNKPPLNKVRQNCA